MATETVNYSYDAKGRLVQIARSGTINNGVVTNYTYDHADNRTNKTTTGSPNPGPP
ncbi:MAG TPA: RHS repeat domain-containing protein [Allosphingosinicella sp.]|nr:RHS repeat domain-containing protein [Allosphingosinicella sp.]